MPREGVKGRVIGVTVSYLSKKDTERKEIPLLIRGEVGEGCYNPFAYVRDPEQILLLFFFFNLCGVGRQHLCF